MPRPFPFPISVGTDICSIPRIRRLLFTKSYERLFQKVLTPKEFKIHWPRFKKIFRGLKLKDEFQRALSENFNPGHLVAKRKQLGLQHSMPSRDSVAIKEGTDAEPMRVGDDHILRMLNIVEENIRNAINSSVVDIDRCTSFLAGRYVGWLTMPLLSRAVTVRIVLPAFADNLADGQPKKPSSRHTIPVD